MISNFLPTASSCAAFIAALLAITAARGDEHAKLQPLPSPWQARASTVVDSEERLFRNDSAMLSGTLYVPRSEKPVPAVVVLHAASSPLRDNPLYSHLIQMLPALNIAVFVFDRRGSGKSEGKLAESDYEMLADDGIAAQRMLGQDARIDPRRIGFWGLSQGGWLSLLAASRSPRAAFAVSVSAPMTTPDVQMKFAVANILRIRGFAQADIDQAIATRNAVDNFYRGAIDRATAQAKLDAAAEKPWFEHTYMGKTLRDPAQSRWVMEMRHDPLAVVKTVRQPALVLYGAADPWVPVELSIERMKSILKDQTLVDLVVITGADHAMSTTVAPVDQIDPVRSAQAAPDSVEYFAVLGAWLASQGLTRSMLAPVELVK